MSAKEKEKSPRRRRRSPFFSPRAMKFSSPSIYSQLAVIVDIQLLLAPRRGVRNVELLFGGVNGGRKKRECALRG